MRNTVKNIGAALLLALLVSWTGAHAQTAGGYPSRPTFQAVGAGITPVSSVKYWALATAGITAFRSDSPAATQNNAFLINQPGQTPWTIYQPASSSNLVLYSGADRVVLTSSGTMQINNAGGVGLTVTGGGASITGNSTITGTLGGLTGLTVASGGAAITGGLAVDGQYFPVVKVKTAATNHAAAPVNDPDLQAAVVAGTYVYDIFQIWYSSSGTVTPTLNLNCTCTFTAASSSAAPLFYSSGGTSLLGANVQASAATVVWTLPAANALTATPTIAMIHGTLVATGAGTFAFSFGGVGGGGAQLQPGSYLRLQRVL